MVDFWRRRNGFNPRAHERRDGLGALEKRLELFQSTRPREARQFIDVEFPKLLVSIHAPTRGATSKCRIVNIKRCFNPRAHERRDDEAQNTTPSQMFQSTRPREARRPKAKVMTLVRFNPRAHERRDILQAVPDARDTVSIHAPTRGATRNYYRQESAWCFNPRAHERRDILQAVPDARDTVSIHAPTRGATLLPWLNTVLVKFQSTRPREARH